MKTERPILFSTEMVRAIQEGRKTQTRRLVKPQPDKDVHLHISEATVLSGSNKSTYIFSNPNGTEIVQVQCPYGKVGDTLWVREKWKPMVNCQTLEESVYFYAIMPEKFHEMYPSKWKPSIHLKRKDARIQLEITKISIEPLQNISRDDARAEGIRRCEKTVTQFHNYLDNTTTYNERTSFYSLWQSIHGVDSVSENPFVWVIVFKVLEIKQ